MEVGDGGAGPDRGDAGPGAGEGRGDAGSARALVRSLLDRHPDGLVMTVGDAGLSVPPPEDLPLTTQRLLTGRSIIDFVVPEHQGRIVDAWAQVRAVGGSRTLARLHGAEQETMLHFVDGRPAHGVFVVVLGAPVGDEPGSGPTPELPVAPEPPRLAQVRKDEVSVFIGADAATTAMLGWTEEELLQTRSLDLVHPDDQTAAIESWLDLLARPRRQRRVRLRYRTVDGGWRWLEITNHNRLDDEAHRDVLAEMLDVTDEMTALEALRANEQLLRRLAETVPVGLAQVDLDGRITYVNDRLGQIVGRPPRASLAEQFAGADAQDAPALAAAVAAVLRDGEDRDVECRFAGAAPGAEPVQALVAVRGLADDTGVPTGAIVCVSDVTDSVRVRDDLAERTRRDPLTGGRNRRGLLEELDARLAAPGRRTAVLFVDLDGFKGINDELGHRVGDEVLRTVNRRLVDVTRPGDVVGRLGGDEFVVVCADLDAASARSLADRADFALAAPLPVDGRDLVVRASIGVALTGTVATGPAEAIAAADAAMYRAKHDRRAGGAGLPVLVDLGIDDADELPFPLPAP